MEKKNKQYYIKTIGTLAEVDGVQYINFAFKVPRHYKKLLSVELVSPDLLSQPSDDYNVELSMWVNNRKTPVGNHNFVLGYHELDDVMPRQMIVNRAILQNNEITGYVKYLAGTGSFDVKLYLTFEGE